VVKSKIDPDSTGFIKFENLKQVMEEKLKDVDTVDDLIALFKKLDKNDDGEIPVPEFKTYMLTLGTKLSPEEIDAMIKEAGGDTSGVIDIQSFCERLCPQPPPEKKKA
jgi:Ca2+-binding EF-hand superfamily protein